LLFHEKMRKIFSGKIAGISCWGKRRTDEAGRRGFGGARLFSLSGADSVRSRDV
jgi:hypothetical protein